MLGLKMALTYSSHVSWDSTIIHPHQNPRRVSWTLQSCTHILILFLSMHDYASMKIYIRTSVCNKHTLYNVPLSLTHRLHCVFVWGIIKTYDLTQTFILSLSPTRTLACLCSTKTLGFLCLLDRQRCSNNRTSLQTRQQYCMCCFNSQNIHIDCFKVTT